MLNDNRPRTLADPDCGTFRAPASPPQDRGRKVDLDEAIKRADTALSFLQGLREVQVALSSSSLRIKDPGQGDITDSGLHEEVRLWLLSCISNKTAEVSERLRSLLDGTMGGKV